MNVAIVILNWNNWRDTIHCLQSLENINYSKYHIFLVDNQSTDDSVDRISSWLQNHYDNKSITFIKNQQNLGYAEGHNRIIAQILQSRNHYDYVFLLNNDTWVDPDFLLYSLRTSQERQAAVVGCVVKGSDGRSIQFDGDNRRKELFYMRNMRKRKKSGEDEPSNWACGCAMMIEVKALKAYIRAHNHIFNPKLFLYGEETEFCLNLWKMGYRIFISKKAVVYHAESASSGGLRKLYYMSRNAIFIANDYLATAWRIFFHLCYPTARLKVIIKKSLEKKWEEAHAILDGVFDGYRNIGGKWRKM